MMGFNPLGHGEHWEAYRQAELVDWKWVTQFKEFNSDLPSECESVWSVCALHCPSLCRHQGQWSYVPGRGLAAVLVLLDLCL